MGVECWFLEVVAAVMDGWTNGHHSGAIWVELVLLGRWDGPSVSLRAW